MIFYNLENGKMKIAKFFKDNRKEFSLFIFLGLMAGAFNMGIIVLANAMIGRLFASNMHTVDTPLIAGFITCLLFWFIFRRLLSFRLIDFTQAKLWTYRKGIITRLLQSDFLELKKHRHKLQTVLTEDVKDVAVASVNLVDFVISIVTALCVFVYLAFLSLPFFVVTVVVSAAGIALYRLSENVNAGYISSGRQKVDAFHQYLNEIVGGFKEIKMDEEKGTVLYRLIKKTGDEATALNAKAFKGYLNNSMIGQLFFYLLIAFLIAFLGRYLNLETPVIVNFLFALLFLIGPLELIMSQIPDLSKGLVALDRIDAVNADFAEPREPARAVPVPEFESLKVINLSYRYEAVSADIPFQCGPLNFEVSRGEVVFISGGNGSGKTTFIHLLLSLLSPGGGGVLINGSENLFQHDKKAYRSLFCPVFSDFFLFQQLYGLADPPESTVAEYFNLFEIDHKVSFSSGRFSTTGLSSGQRKRLALIACLLEGKPILVLDEWAADQDPAFRKKFYMEIIPFLKRKGLTIIAITHDEAYFDQCDKRYHMDLGVLSLLKESTYAL